MERIEQLRKILKGFHFTIKNLRLHQVWFEEKKSPALTQDLIEKLHSILGNDYILLGDVEDEEESSCVLERIEYAEEEVESKKSLSKVEERKTTNYLG